MDSILDPVWIGLISPQSYYTLFSPLSRRCPFQDKHKQKNLCILKTDISLSLPIFPAIRGNHYVIDRHGYPPYFFSSFGGWWMSGCMDKSMLILISLWHRLISSRLYIVDSPNSCVILVLRKAILSASPWTSSTLRGSHWEISCIMPLASAWALKDIYSTAILTSSWQQKKKTHA